jgi:hypothetical protein
MRFVKGKLFQPSQRVGKLQSLGLFEAVPDAFPIFTDLSFMARD